MAKYHPIYTSIWKDPDFQELDTDAKLVFIYLFSNESMTQSGIYPISYKTISDETGVPKERVQELLNGGHLKNILYDTKNRYVFVKNALRRHSRGRPDLLVKAIQNEFERSKKTHLWAEFAKEYPDLTKYLPNIGQYLESVEQDLPNIGQHLESIGQDLPNIGQHLPNIGANSKANINISPPYGGAPSEPSGSSGAFEGGKAEKPPETFEEWAEKLEKQPDRSKKVGVLVNAFRAYHANAPPEDFDKLGDRLGRMSKGGNEKYTLKLILDSAGFEILGSHLDYIQRMKSGARERDGPRLTRLPTSEEIYESFARRRSDGGVKPDSQENRARPQRDRGGGRGRRGAAGPRQA